MNAKTLETIIVPVRCESEQGTAFFISETQLLTARHVVKAHFQSTVASAPTHIYLPGQTLLCRGEELSTTEKKIDLALLTIAPEESYHSTESLSLLCDEYVKNMPLHIYGYPQELAMGRNLVDLEVRNSIEIKDGEWNDRALTRDDKCTLHNYDGLSGSPVVSISGRVNGIIVLQINEMLSYLSISTVKEHLKAKGISYDTNWAEDDITTIGIGRSLQLCKDAIATIHDRYTPELHQENEDLENLLDYISDKSQLDEVTKKTIDLARFVCQLPEKKREMIQKKLKIQQTLNVDILIANDCGLLRHCHEYLRENPFSGFDRRSRGLDIYPKVNQLNDEDFERIKYSHKKNSCLIGKAGSGKTHSLCDYALKKQGKANIYLFFGTNFKVNQPAINLIKDTICQKMSFTDFNEELKKRGRYTVVVIDAINEGLGCSYWNNHLGALRTELEKHDHFRLVISIRTPFDKEVNDLSESGKWHVQTIDGFADKDRAISAYFNKYGIDPNCNSQRIEAFKNPLFLKIFCETFHSLTEEEKQHINKHVLYKRYVAKKNQIVTDFINEDPELHIADRYMSKLANHSVYYGHFNPISRQKARQYGQRMAPYRLWNQDLLHACLTANLLLEDHSNTEVPAVMFEYENLGDYYKAGELLRSNMDVKGLLRWIDRERRFLERNTDIPSEKFRTTVKALFDCWYHKNLNVCDEKMLQRDGPLYELYYEFLMESDIPNRGLTSILLRLENDKINPLILLKQCTEVPLNEVLEIHNKLKKHPKIGSRDLIWTRYVNQMYEMYDDYYIEEILLEQGQTLEESDDKRKNLIRITWMLSSSHPKFRSIIIRKLRKILSTHQTLILWLVSLFEEVNDPYVTGGLFCAIYGVVLPSRDKILTTSIAKHIYHCYYEKEDSVPQDLIVRQWTLKIIERAYYIDETCNYWKNIKTPFKPQQIDLEEISKNGDIDKYFFGSQNGSIMMYNSLFSFEDFNRYIIGTNMRNRSTDYFLPTEDGNFRGVPLDDIKAEMAYYILHIFGWNDKLGYLDNGKYSPYRVHNDQERIGKKFQWLAWYRVNAHLMDLYQTTKIQYYYGEEPETNDFTPHPYPWSSAEVSRFDPTLDIESKYEPKAGLIGIENQLIKGKDDEEWISKNEYLPDFRGIVKHKEGAEFVMLIGYDRTKDQNKETFLFSNTGFVKQKDADKFAKWARDKDFYGRWMPEHHGVTEFLWNEYPWADVYKSSVEHEVWSRPYDCPCDMQLSYEAQLQEDWEGIDRDDEFLSTVYMPCVEMMEQMNLYCSEFRGVIKESNGSVAALNTDHGNFINGLFVRRDLLNEYLKSNGYTMFYYVLGEKVQKIEKMNFNKKDLSAAYQYQPDDEVSVIQPMRVIERSISKEVEDNMTNDFSRSL
ncbi:hypothetical protein POREN0001_0673 [Porphyromonas endodontalis ATCC 35406]|uniref:Trypsin n=1 Tax=Porphyromonas endodontalis (strain ATCC 35406 / DSM 24491 / JCM 8526 / CCUG 16442 / BCRC 14492 / NCTC 13058 / HG 370) TaxID=553175 RepID=C3JCY6_POREA|nr:hypothetical protein POREN0001_0673 [Porphyromonas endodontalis ATCC 35406]